MKNNPPPTRTRITNTTKQTSQTPDRIHKKRSFLIDYQRGNPILASQNERKQGIRYIKEKHETSVDKIFDRSKGNPLEIKERQHFKKAVIKIILIIL